MPTKFKSFEEFGETAKKERGEELQRQIDDIFRKSIKDDFDSVPEGPFKSSLPEVEWISFARPADKKTGERNPNVLNAVVFSKDKSGKNKNHTWTVNRNGTIKPVQPIPPELAKEYSQEEVALEIASLLERIGPSFIHLTDLDIIPTQDSGTERAGSGEEGGREVEKPIDPERLNFFRSFRDAKFISANRSKGLKGYLIVFFDNSRFLVVENEYKGNAAFIVDLPETIKMGKIEQELSARKRQENVPETVSKDELRSEIEKRFWQPVSEKAKSRNELRTLGAQRIVHTQGSWQDNMRQAIESRIGS